MKHNITPIQWSAILPRPILANACNDPDAALPDCTKEFSFNNGEELLGILERHISDTLKNSKALSPADPPPVRLKRIATFLNCDLNYNRNWHMPSGWGVQPNLKLYPGTVRLEKNGRWFIDAGNPKLSRTRVTVAHELGHVLLYNYNPKKLRFYWEARRWSIQEECLANFIGRNLLIPDELMPRTKEVENVAEYLIAEIQGKFSVSREVACLRWLDLPWPQSQRTNAIILWRQYHPFDFAFLVSILRDFEKECPRVRKILLILRSKRAKSMLEEVVTSTPWQDAIKLWRNVFSKPSKACDLSFEILEQLAKEIGLLPNPIYEAVSSILSGFETPLTFFLDKVHLANRWLNHAFVPTRRGSLRRHSQAYRLACDYTTSETDTDLKLRMSNYVKTYRKDVSMEHFSIGDLKGHFEVHGFASGYSWAGNRIIIQVLLGEQECKQNGRT